MIAQKIVTPFLPYLWMEYVSLSHQYWVWLYHLFGPRNASGPDMSRGHKCVCVVWLGSSASAFAVRSCPEKNT